MSRGKTGFSTCCLIWFGAAVSIAEIEAGCAIGGNWLALLAGHALGGVMLWAAGMLGASTGKNAMETTVGTFGVGGMRFFAALNVVQLVGWTAVMIAQGGTAVSELTGLPHGLMCAGLAVLIGIWIFIALGDRLHLATLAVGALALLSLALSWKLLGVGTRTEVVSAGFWPAFEISVAMPLSWLPLISDYTSTASRPRAATAASAVVYTVASLWMYALGVLLSRIGATSVANGIVKSGLGAIGLVVIVFSTVTTTFLDAYSSGESVRSVFPGAPTRLIGVGVCAVGAVLAVAGVTDHYIGFLYLISSVFAPMATVLLADRYLIRRGGVRWNLLAWLVGFVVYRLSDASPVGPTLTAVGASAVAALVQLAWTGRSGLRKIEEIR